MQRKKVFSAVLAISAAASFLIAFACSCPVLAALSTNASADVAVGQADLTSNLPNHGISPVSTAADQMYLPRTPFWDGNKFFVADMQNNRVLIYNSIPTSSGASADVVIGQQDMTHNGPNQGGDPAANTLSGPSAVFSDGSKLFIADTSNNRVLIYNSIPTGNNASADLVIGQSNMTSSNANQGGAVGANTLYSPTSLFFNGKKIIVSDWENQRVLIYNSVPTANGANADVVIGQQNMTSSDVNQGGSVAANTLYYPNGVYSNGNKLFIADQWNHRVLIFNSVPTGNNALADVVIGQQNMTSNGENQGGSVAANTLSYPTHIFPYGPKLLVLDSANSRMLVFNSVPTGNNALADVVIGQQNMTSNGENQGGVAGASTLNIPRGVFVGSSKLMIGDYFNHRVLIYNSFGSMWTIAKNHSQTLTGGEKIKVKKKKLEFSGKKKEYKKGRVRIVVNNISKKLVKIKKSGKWKASFKDSGSAVKDIVIRYYNSHRDIQLNSETYRLGINRGNLVEASIEQAGFSGKLIEKSESKPAKREKFDIPEADPKGR